MKEGVTSGRELLQRHCNFNGEAFRPSCADSTYEDKTDDKEGGSNVTNVTFVPNAPSKGVESQKKSVTFWNICEHL